MVQVTSELEYFIGLVAEAKMHLLLVVHCRVGSDERRSEIWNLQTCTARARQYCDEHGGLESLPANLAVELRVCEKAVEHFIVQDKRAETTSSQ